MSDSEATPAVAPQVPHPTLNTLLDEDSPGSKPKYSLHMLIRCAIMGAPNQTLTSDAIIEAIEDRFVYFSHSSTWKKQVLKILSFTTCFKPEGEGPDVERALYWTYDPSEDPFVDCLPHAIGIGAPVDESSTSRKKDKGKSTRSASTSDAESSDPGASGSSLSGSRRARLNSSSSGGSGGASSDERAQNKSSRPFGDKLLKDKPRRRKPKRRESGDTDDADVPGERPTRAQMKAIKHSKRAVSGFSLGDDHNPNCVIC